MLKVGLTGGIGSGKTIVGEFFKSIGVPVYNSDMAAKHLAVESVVIREALVSRFGGDVYLPDGSQNRRLLADIIFNDKDALEFVNSIYHPVVAEHFEAWVRMQIDAPYVVKEAAILFESGAYRQMDKTVLVVAPLELRIDRVSRRDGCVRELVLSRIKSQMPDEAKLKLADFVVCNDEVGLLIPQLLRIDGCLRAVDV